MEDDKLESSNNETDSEKQLDLFSQNPHNFSSLESVDLTNILGTLNSASITFASIPSSPLLTVPANYQYNNVNYGFQSTNQLHPSLQVTGKVNVDGENADIILNGHSLREFMSKLESRLAILQPNPEKLEQFEALKKAYEHYKLLESLCEIQDKNEE